MIKASRRVGIDVSNPLSIFIIRSKLAGIENIRLSVALLVECFEHGFRLITQLNTKVIDQFELAIYTDLRINRQFGVSRTALDQRAPRVIAHTTHNRSTDTGRANDRVWFATVLF